MGCPSAPSARWRLIPETRIGSSRQPATVSRAAMMVARLAARSIRRAARHRIPVTRARSTPAREAASTGSQSLKAMGTSTAGKVKLRQSAAQGLEAVEVVDGAVLVDVGEEGADSLGAGLKACPA